MKRILALSFALLLLLTACTTPAATPHPLVGSWTGEIDDASRINLLLADAYGAEMAQYWNIDSFPVTIVMTFREDGTYSQNVDKDKLEIAMEQFREDLSTGLNAFLEDLIAASDSTITVEELMDQLNISVDDLLNTVFSEESIGQVEQEYTFEGNYQTEDGKLYTSVGLDYNVDKNWYETYELNGDTLTLLSLVCTEDGQEADQDRYPIVLTKTE